MGDGTESQDSTVYYIICGTSLFNILGCIFSFTIISLVRQYESEYSSRLLKAIVFASFWLSLSMLVTPYGYDSDDTTLPSTGQCEWQSFLFVLFSEARWWFTVILFSSECRKVILDSWPTKNFLAHNMLAWGYSILLAAVGWILTAVLSDDIYSWQWSGRCGIKSDTDNGALFLLSKLVIDLLLMIWILKYYCMARFILSNREQMRSHSPDTGVVGMWMEDYYERVMSRQSVYFHIGGWGCFVKAIVMIWELLLVLSQFDILDVDSGKISVTMEVSATCIYGFFIFLALHPIKSRADEITLPRIWLIRMEFGSRKAISGAALNTPHQVQGTHTNLCLHHLLHPRLTSKALAVPKSLSIRWRNSMLNRVWSNQSSKDAIIRYNNIVHNLMRMMYIGN